MLERVPKHLPQPFNSDIQNSLTSRLKGLGYWLAAVVADVSQMLGKVNHKGPGYLANIDHVAGLTGDGIHQVVALTHERPLDVHLAFGTSDGGVGEQVGAMPCICQQYRGMCLVWSLHGCGGCSVQECYAGLDLF